MKQYRAFLLSASSAACFAVMLNACSGGGGGVGGVGAPPTSSTPTPSPGTPAPSPSPTPAPEPTPTPSPTPTPTANDDLIAPLVSESFVNDGAVANGSFPTDGTMPTLSAAPQATTFSYDAGNDSYTFAAGGRSVTFLPSHRDASLSNAAVTVYVIRSGSTTDTLTLTNAGTSGRFTFRYVGAGYWQRTVEGANTVTGSINAVTYGVPTPAAAISAAGRAEYQLDLIGAMTTGGAPQGFTGTGLLQVDLGTGQLTMSGGFGPAGSGSTIQANGQLVSGTGRISGSFSVNINGFNSALGQLSGRFYGPSSGEVGGTFAAASTTTGVSAVVGSFAGRGAAIANLPFDPGRVNSHTAGIAATVEGGKVSVAASHDAPLEVRYDAATDTYTLINSERSFAGKPFVAADFARDTDTITTSNPLGLQFVKAIQWTDRRRIGAQSRYFISESVSGTRTADADVPRTGNAGYQIAVAGSLAEVGATDLARNLSGAGQLFLDFGTGKIDANGTLVNGVPSGTTFSGTGQLSSSTNGFTGTLNVAMGSGYSGGWSGSLYGPAAVELGSAFTLSNGSGSVIAGTLTGKTNPDLTLDPTRLIDLTATTTFKTLLAFRDGTVTRVLGPNAASVVTFNPTTQQYDVALNQHASTNLPDVRLTPALRDAVASNATFDVYSTRLTGTRDYDVTAKILRPGSANPTIALNYVGFADISYRWSPIPGDNQYFDFATVFGMNTPALQMARTGSASYAGIATGGAQTYTAAAGVHHYALSGTSQFNFNFQSAQMNGSLALNGVDRGTGATRDFGNFAFSGNGPVGNSGTAVFNGFFSNISGSISGGFFGPRGPELGAVFTMDSGGAEQIRINGATVARLQP